MGLCWVNASHTSGEFLPRAVLRKHWKMRAHALKPSALPQKLKPLSLGRESVQKILNVEFLVQIAAGLWIGREQHLSGMTCVFSPSPPCPPGDSAVFVCPSSCISSTSSPLPWYCFPWKALFCWAVRVSVHNLLHPAFSPAPKCRPLPGVCTLGQTWAVLLWDDLEEGECGFSKGVGWGAVSACGKDPGEPGDVEPSSSWNKGPVVSGTWCSSSVTLCHVPISCPPVWFLSLKALPPLSCDTASLCSKFGIEVSLYGP